MLKAMLLLLSCALMAAAAPSHADRPTITPAIAVSAGMVWERIPAHVYVSSYPLLFTTQWTNFHSSNLTMRPINESYGLLYNAQEMLRQLNTHLDHNLDDYTKRLTLQTAVDIRTQSSKAIKALGSFAEWCCGVLNHKHLKQITGNEDILRDYIMEVQRNIETDHTFLIDATNEMNRYSQHLSTALGRQHNFTMHLKNAVQELRNILALSDDREQVEEQIFLHQIETTVHLAQQISEIPLRHEAVDKCHSRHLPAALLPPATLRPALMEIQTSLYEYGLKLAIPIQSLGEYYDIAIADCTFAGQLVLLIVKIPLIRTDDNFILYNPIPIPFAFKDQTCHLDITPTIVVHSRATTFGLLPHQLRTCEPWSTNLCQVPITYLMQNALEDSCYQASLQGTEIADLRKRCPLKCIPNTEMTAIQIDLEHIIVTHPRMPIYYFNNEGIQKMVTENPEYGAIYLTIPCGYWVISATEPVVSPATICPNESYSEIPKPIQIVLAAWTINGTLGTIHESWHLTSFDRIDQIINHNWTMDTPQYHTPLPYDLTFERIIAINKSLYVRSIIEWILAGWLLVITVFVIIFESNYLRNLFQL